MTDALGNVTAYAYDGNGNLTAVTDALGNTTAFEYDALGQLASYRDGENTENYLYDMLGNRMAKQVNENLAAAYRYNAMNQLTAMTQGEDAYSYLYDRRGNLTEEKHGEQVLRQYVYDATNRMVSGKNLVSGTKSEYTYNGLLARVKKTLGTNVLTYIPDYLGGIQNDLVTQISGAGTVNAGYGRVSQRQARMRWTPISSTTYMEARCLRQTAQSSGAARGALEGAVKGGAYNIADVLDNKLRNAYNARNRRNGRTLRSRNPWNKKNQNPRNSRNLRPTGSRSPQSNCGRPKPLKGIRNPKRSSRDRAYYARPNDRFSLRSFVRDAVAGAVMDGLSSVAFYGAGKAVEALKRGVERWKTSEKRSNIYYHVTTEERARSIIE